MKETKAAKSVKSAKEVNETNSDVKKTATKSLKSSVKGANSSDEAVQTQNGGDVIASKNAKSVKSVELKTESSIADEAIKVDKLTKKTTELVEAAQNPAAHKKNEGDVKTTKAKTKIKVEVQDKNQDQKDINQHANDTKDATNNDELNEQALLAMADDDYMNKAQLNFFKKRLQKIKHDILENADQTTENLRETVHVPDPVDRASIEEEHALELRTRDRERKLLAKIEQSLKKIEDGSYGWCDETGEPIGVPRLLARPTANLCLEAQERRELRQKMFGD